MIAAGLKLGIISIFFFHYEARRIVTVLPDNCRKFAVITLIRTSDINHRDSKIHALVEVKQGESFCSSLKKFPDNVSNVSPSFLSTKNWLLVAMQTYCSLRLSQCNKRIFKYIHACTNYISEIWIICWLFDFRKKKAWITYEKYDIKNSNIIWILNDYFTRKKQKKKACPIPKLLKIVVTIDHGDIYLRIVRKFEGKSARGTRMLAAVGQETSPWWLVKQGHVSSAHRAGPLFRSCGTSTEERSMETIRRTFLIGRHIALRDDHDDRTR